MKVKKIPMRMCVGCKELKPKKELLRIVVLPTGVIEVDRTGKKSGRGVYVCDSMDCFNKAYENHGLEKSLKRPVSKDVYEALKALNVEKETAVYIGDSDVDINTAKNSGLPCISVLWGFRDKDFLIGNGATTFISKPIELLDY